MSTLVSSPWIDVLPPDSNMGGFAKIDYEGGIQL